MLWKYQSKIESRLSDVLTALQSRHAAEVSTALRRTGSIPADLWRKIEQETAQKMLPHLSQAYQQAASQLSGKLGAGVNARTLEDAAIRWASEYLSRVSPTLTASAQDAVAKLELEPDLKPAERLDRVSAVFGQSRAKRLATTETTRAAAEGEGPVARLFNRTAETPVLPVWMTSEDGATCPICFPLNESLPSSGWASRIGLTEAQWREYADASGVLVTAWDLTVAPDGPPAHPNCRCRIEWTEVGQLPEFKGQKLLSVDA